MPGETFHMYYCSYCQRSLFGETLGLLAKNVNNHNTIFHPADFTDWGADTISLSAHYVHASDSSRKTLPQYTVPFGATTKSEWGDAKAPTITEDDRALLAKNGVKW